MIHANGQGIRIRELIKHLSDKEGGVHKQRKEIDMSEQKNLLIRHIGETLQIGDTSSVLTTLCAIIRVVIRSLNVFKSQKNSL